MKTQKQDKHLHKPEICIFPLSKPKNRNIIISNLTIVKKTLKALGN